MSPSARSFAARCCKRQHATYSILPKSTQTATYEEQITCEGIPHSNSDAGKQHALTWRRKNQTHVKIEGGMYLRLLGSQQIKNGELYFGGVSAKELVEQFETPLYVFDAPAFRETIRSFVAAARRAHDDVRVAYASKANGALGILAIAGEEGIDIDVASEGELEGALLSGCKREDIHLHGSNKSIEEIARANRERIGYIVIDNLPEIDKLAALCARRQKVMLRLAPGVDPVTHKAISTGQEDTKFGLNIADGSAQTALREVLRHSNLQLCGYHCHVGSQLLDSDAVAAGARRLAEFALSAEVEIEELNLGGGLGVAYLPEQSPPSFEEFCKVTAQAALEPFALKNMPLPRLSWEPGRALVAEAGTTVYTIGVSKNVNAGTTRRYLSVDGGLADNPRPQLYDAVYYALNASRMHEPHAEAFRIAGRHCETDTLISEIHLPKTTREGDLLAVQCTGAYNFAMASNYNRYPRPAMVIVGEGEPYLAVERESLADMFRLERMRQKQFAG